MMSRVFKKHWGIFCLLVILGLIIVRNFSVSIDINGWDNFGIHLDLPLNLFRTIFSSWREYRGLGAPNDSEGVDIFRVVFFIFLSLFFKLKVLNMVYYFLLLGTGCLGMFFLSMEIAKESKLKLFQRHFYLELMGFLAGLMYLFSLHTIGTFYLPIVMYVARYAFFPVVLLFFLRLSKGLWSKSNVFFFCIFTLFLSTSYLTATVFLTFCLILMMIGVSRLRLFKSFFLTGLLFIFLNSFWLFGFINYATQKSSILPLASTFIEVNEIQLNQAEKNFSWENIVTYKPSFFTTTYQAPDRLQSYLHPLVDQLAQSNFLRILILIPSFLGLTGLFLILFVSIYKKNMQLLWIVCLAVLTLILLRRENPPTGFIYDFLGANIPFFKIIFRFGAEKFSQLLVISLSTSAALFMVMVIWSMQFFKKYLIKSVGRFFQLSTILIFSFIVIYPYAPFWMNSGFFSPIVHVNIPTQYQQVSELLANDSTGRVLQLPFDRYSYWKSYQWGYVGSSFFHFFLPSALIDRTFEPASVENDELDQTILTTLQNGQYLEQPYRKQRALQFYNLLEKTDTQFVMVDESIDKQVLARNSQYWGDFNLEDSKAIVQEAEQAGLFIKIFDEPLSGNFSNAQPPHLIVYKTVTSPKMFQAHSQVVEIDPALKNSFVNFMMDKGQDYIQDTASKTFRTYPFYRYDSQLTEGGQHLTLQTKYQPTDPISHVGFEKAESESQLVAVFTERSNEGLRVRLKRLSNPLDFQNISEQSQFNFDFQLPEKGLNSAATQSLDGVVGNWAMISDDVLANYRLQIGPQVLPIPQTAGYLGTVLLSDSTFTVNLLKKNDTVDLKTNMVEKTADFNCFKDKTSGYQSSLDYLTDRIQVITKEGTSCLTFPVVKSGTQEVKHVEVKFTAQAELEKNINEKVINSALFQRKTSRETDTYVKSLPERMSLGLCFIDPDTGQCLNTTQGIEINTQREVWAPLEKSVQRESDVQVLFTLPSFNKDFSHFELSQIQTDVFGSVGTSGELTLNQTNGGDSLPFEAIDRIDIPYVFSDSAFFMNSERQQMVESFTRGCEKETGYRTVRTFDETRSIGYVSDCQQGFYTFVPFNPQHLYVWTAQYMVYSGKDPKFLLEQKGRYKDEYLSRYSLFPNIPGFRTLQRSDAFLGGETEDAVNSIKQLFTITPTHEVFTTVPPQLGVENEKNIIPFQITQHSENQGLLEIAKMNVMALPGSWDSFFVDFGNVTHSYVPVQITASQRVLPSLWKMDFLFPQSDEKTQSLIEFGQAFDTQWGIYRGNSFLSALLFGRVDARHVKVNGWSNGWVLNPDIETHGASQHFYVFYWPELLSWLGWSVTSSVFVGVLISMFKKRKHVHK
ncbi:MAG: hypothetical protein ABI425_03640 [Patescibacteria group bacterium]